MWFLQLDWQFIVFLILNNANKWRMTKNWQWKGKFFPVSDQTNDRIVCGSITD